MIFSGNKPGWFFPALKTLVFGMVLFFVARILKGFVAWGDRDKKPNWANILRRM